MHAHHALLAFLLVLAGGVASAQEKAVPPQLLQAVKDADPAVRVKAIMGLSRLGAEAVPVMVEALKDEEANVSSAAAYGLRLIKLEPTVLRESLRPFLADKSASVRQGVAGALSRGGPEAIPLLLPLLQDEGFEVRRTTVQSLQSIVQKAPKAADDALPGLAKALKDEEPKVRLAVVQALPRFGPKAVAVILAALSDADPKVRAYAAAALSPFKLESERSAGTPGEAAQGRAGSDGVQSLPAHAHQARAGRGARPDGFPERPRARRAQVRPVGPGAHRAGGEGRPARRQGDGRQIRPPRPAKQRSAPCRSSAPKGKPPCWTCSRAWTPTSAWPACKCSATSCS